MLNRIPPPKKDLCCCCRCTILFEVFWLQRYLHQLSSTKPEKRIDNETIDLDGNIKWAISFLCDKFDIFVHWCKSTYSKGFIKSAGLKRSLGSKATVHQLFIFSKLKFFEWPQWKREETDVFEHITVKQIKLLEIALHTMLQYMSG